MGVAELPDPSGEDSSQVRLLHDVAKIHATVDNPNLARRAAAARPAGAAVRGRRLAAETDLPPQEAARGVRSLTWAHEDQGQELAGPGLNALVGTVSTSFGRAGDRGRPAARRQRELGPGCRLVRRRSGPDRRATGCTGIVVVRADSAFYSAAFTRAVRRAARSSRSRADEPARPGGHRGHRRGRLGAHPLYPPSGMTSCGAGLRRRGRRDPPIPRLPRRKARRSPPG
jgi:hypothetical protein